MKFFLSFLSIFIVSIKVLAQLSGGFESNAAYYIDDKEISIEQNEAKNRLRSNNYLRLDYKYRKFTSGIQLETYAQKALLNYSPNFKNAGLGTCYVEYNNDSARLSITVGHFYEQFGSGLTLRTWEDRQLGIANSIIGGRIKYEPIKFIELTTLYGKQRNGLNFKTTNSKIFGVNSEIRLNELLKAKQVTYGLGFSFVNRKEDANYANLNKSTYLTSVRGNIQKGSFSLDAEYAFKSNDALVEFGNVLNGNQFDGDAYLLNVGYVKKGLGISANFRRVENFQVFTQRNLSGNIYNEAGLNYIPSLTKQYDYSLANIYVYAAQPRVLFDIDRNKAGEIGGQFDIVYQIKKHKILGGKYGTNISLNYAQWHGLDAKFNVADKKYVASKFGFGQKFYHEISLEIRKKITKKFSTVITYLNQYYNATYVEETVGKVNANTIAIDNTLKIGKTDAIKFELQHQWANSKFKNWAAAQLEYNLKSKWSFFAIDLYNYGNDDNTKRIHYYNLGLAFKPNASRFQISYGRQRGGLICVGGVCRFVPQSAGLNASVTYSF